MTGRRVLKLGSLIALVLILAALPMLALAQDTMPEPAATEELPAGALPVTITGTVTHGTAGSTIPADLTVTLRIISTDMSETTLETVAGADGAFAFADVPVAVDHIYVATVEYQDAVFSSALIQGDQLMAAPELPVTIFEFTSDPSVLAIELLQSQVSVSLNEMQVLDLYRFTNTSDRAYRAEDGASVRVRVAEGGDVMNMGSTRFSISDDGQQVIDLAPVVPGQSHTLHVIYTMPYGGEVTVRRTVDYPLLNGFQVVIGANGLSVTGDGLEPVGGSDEGMTFGVAASMPAGSTVSFTISGIPADAAATETQAPAVTTVPALSVVLMLLGGICIGVAAVLFIRERRRAPVPAAAAPAKDPRVNALVQQIAELDVAFQAGKLEKQPYETQRAALKSELMSLARGSSSTTEENS